MKLLLLGLAIFTSMSSVSFAGDGIFIDRPTYDTKDSYIFQWKETKECTREGYVEGQVSAGYMGAHRGVCLKKEELGDVYLTYQWVGYGGKCTGNYTAGHLYRNTFDSHDLHCLKTEKLGNAYWVSEDRKCLTGYVKEQTQFLLGGLLFSYMCRKQEVTWDQALSKPSKLYSDEFIRKVNTYSNVNCSQLKYDMAIGNISKKTEQEEKAALRAEDLCIEMLPDNTKAVTCMVDYHLKHGGFPLEKNNPNCHKLIKNHIYGLIELIYGGYGNSFLEKVTRKLFR